MWNPWCTFSTHTTKRLRVTSQAWDFYQMVLVIEEACSSNSLLTPSPLRKALYANSK